MKYNQLSVSQPYAPRLTPDGKVSKRNVSNRIYSVVVPVFGLVRAVAVTVFRPRVTPCVGDDTLRPPREVQAVTLQDVQP